MSGLYVGFEEPIGAGKTTLATLFAQHASWDLILEDFHGNEFLADFYSDKSRWALAMQLSFLVARHEQLAAVAVNCASSVVADYTYAKDAMFAQLLLTERREWRIYDRVQRNLAAKVRQPDLIVYLDAPNGVLIDRIQKRGRAYESTIDDVYLNNLRSAYENALLASNGSKILKVETSMLDIESKDELGELYRDIFAHI